VETDDDISGTFTFVRALEDSGLYASTPEEFFGETWLNYLIEYQTILWWGGMGMSTEHTAYHRLKAGIKAPRSGSMELNGKVVAEQIGAQIFIDGFGLVAPGRPDLAAELARRAASVSHDGEAVHAAVVVAGMVSAAFTEKRMGRLLDIGVSLIPRDSLVAKVHRDVRRWARRNRDWKRTFHAIEREYGYTKYGGNCHVIPNHAVMVMAWAYTGSDFHEAMKVVNTAGWDTDCNSGNVGCVTGLVAGLEGICAKYDYRSPAADQVRIPTADPSTAISDAAAEALRIARMGRRVMGWPGLPAPKGGARWHFSLPGSVQGWTRERAVSGGPGPLKVWNAEGHSRQGKRSLRVGFPGLAPDEPARVSTPLIESSSGGGYAMQGVSIAYPGMAVTIRGAAGSVRGRVRARPFFRSTNPKTGKADRLDFGRPVALAEGRQFVLRMAAPATGGFPIHSTGVELESPNGAVGEVFIDSADLSGTPRTEFPLRALSSEWGKKEIQGWMVDSDLVRGPLPDDPDDSTWFGRGEGRGFLVTGSGLWKDYSFEASLAEHLPGKTGLLARWQGQKRHLALVKTRDTLQLVVNYYGETVLDSVPMKWKEGTFHTLKLVMKGPRVAGCCDGKPLLKGVEDRLLSGGAGIFFDTAMTGVRKVRVG
jgi:hypothetical protein